MPRRGRRSFPGPTSSSMRRSSRAPLALAAVAVFSLLSPVRALAAPAAVPTASPAVPAAPVVPGAELAPRHQRWLEDVALLISEPERQGFLSLRQDYQRDAFIRRFWQVRDPQPETGRNELQRRWEERVQIARERYGGLTQDRAKMLLWNGPPQQTETIHCADVLLPLEIWSYASSELIHGTFTLVFYEPLGSSRGIYRLWYPGEGVGRLLNFALSSQLSPDQQANPGPWIASCARGDAIIGALSQAVDWSLVEAKRSPVPKPGEEWLKTFLARSTELPEGAALLPARLDLLFPARRQSRTVVQGQVAVPRKEAGLAKVGEHASYDFVVDGEVLREGELFDQFRYRFSLPEVETKSDEIPLVFERTLRPGTYRMILRVEDAGGKRYYREDREIAVPGAEGITAAPAPEAASGGRLAEANAAIPAGEQTVRLLPATPGLKVGSARVEALTTGEGIAKLVFELNGRAIFSKAHPPYSVEIPLGLQPRTHRLRVRALDEKGVQLATDELLLNAGPHRFSVRMVEPQPGKSYRSSLRAQVEVEVPQGEQLDRVELFLDEDRVATLYQKPFVQPILLPEGGKVSYVRAVAYLADGNSTEDVVLVNAPESTQVDVDLVELYTSVVDRKGRPVDDLDRADFRVFEDGAEQNVVRFEKVRDLPIYAGVLLDTSASMTDQLDEAVKGALRFFETVITSKDRAMVITFSDRPTLAVPFTNDREELMGGLANLVADGNTALYDSIIQALYNFGGLKGKRAILILTDGRDEGSRYSYADALDYAKRSGVAIYAVGMRLSTKDADVHLKLHQLAEQTGGRSFFIDRAAELDAVYKAVEEEVRSQYLLSYQSTQSGTGERDRFRSVEIKVGKPGLEAKTIPGYYP